MRSIAINIGANTNEPGFRGPVYPDGRFEYLPIPESEPTAEPVPTYGNLVEELSCSVPDDVYDTPVHLDPEFASYPCCARYTYGDEHAVKAGPLSSLSAGDFLFFYATLSVAETETWLPPAWGAFLIGQFRLARDPVVPADHDPVPDVFANNAHLKRETNDARVLLLGEADQSRLYDHAVPLSRSSGGTDANWLVTDCSNDSGNGPWWRRPLRFDETSTETLLDVTTQPPFQVENYQT